MDRLRRMEIFVAVAESGQFTRAAQVVSLSKSAVSHAISDLEAYLGVLLIARDNRNFQLTDAGRDYLVECRRIIADIEELEDSTRNDEHVASGRIRISAPIAFGTHKLTAILHAFMAQNPAVELSLDLTDRFVDLVREGGDIAIRIAELADSTMIARPLTAIKMRLCASPAFIDRNRNLLRLDDLLEVNCLKYIPTTTWQLNYQGKEVTFTPKGQLESSSGESLREFAIAGAGVAYLPDFIVEQAFREGKLQQLLPAYDGKAYGVYALYPQNKHRPLRVRRLIDFLAAALNDNSADHSL